LPVLRHFQQSTVDYWVQHGADRSKLVLGVPLYGRSFQLSQPRNTNLGAPSSGAGTPGQFSQEAGMLMYNEV
jgi:chitinase